MKIFEYLERINRMNRLLLRRRTGTPDEMARQLGVSRTTLYELIDELKSRGAPIEYSKSLRTFYYSQPYDISISCTLQPLNSTEEKESAGGYNFLTCVLFFRTMPFYLSTVSLPC